MPADLTVVFVKLPSPLVAPCPLTIVVSIQNIGTDAADPVPYDVTIELGSGADGAMSRFEAIVTGAENQRLTPGRTIDVPVTVQFPCTSPVDLRAWVDRKRQIPNNVRTAPWLPLPGVTPTPVPWLAADLTIEIQDALGFFTPDPDAICPGKPVLASIVITNRGCALSQPSTTEVSLEDAAATPLPSVLAGHKYTVPSLSPGAVDRRSMSLPTPASAAGTSGRLGVRVRADADFANPDQCDRASLGAWIEKPFSTGAAPRLALTVGGAGVIRPGERPVLSWSVRNECSEIGVATVRILFGTPATEIYAIQVLIPLQTTAARDVIPSRITIPPAIASAFWTIGTKSLELEVTGTGVGGGPYRISVPINVIPEPMDDTWWTWGALPPAPAFFGPFWKSTYVVTGTFANNGLAAMTVTALSALEHPTDVVGTGEDLTVAPLIGVFTAAVAPGGSVGATFSRFQAWTWLAKGTFVEVGPRSRTFSYIATFSVTDAFGNVYPMIASAPMTVPVTVPFRKIALHAFGILLLAIALGMAATAVYLSGAGPYGWIGALIAAAIAMALVLSATFLLYDAYDPPVPDFRERGPALPDPRAWDVPEIDDESLHPLRTLALLVARVVSAQVRARHHRDRAWAAFVDRDESARVHHRDRARDELETLRRLAPATVDAADEAHEKWEEILGEIQSLPTVESLREATPRFADELGLTDHERAVVDERLKRVDAGELRRALDHTRANGLRTIGEMVRRIHETIATDIAEREYLR